MATQTLIKTPPQIVDEKEERKKKLKEVLVMALIFAWALCYKSVKLNKSLFQKRIYDYIYDELQDKMLSLKITIEIIKHIHLKDKEKEDQMLKDIDMAYNKGKRLIRDILNEFESSEKQKYINYILSSEENIFLASMHDDCAKGHLKYQGEYYYKDENHKVEGIRHSVEWVIGSPVWLITRPNCRHYLVPVSDDFYKNNPNGEKATNQLGIHTAIGERGLGQTMSRGYYPSALIEEYRDRYKILQGLYKITPSAKIYGKMTKMQILINQIKKEQ